jgi:hypothetical protein
MHLRSRRSTTLAVAAVLAVVLYLGLRRTGALGRSTANAHAVRQRKSEAELNHQRSIFGNESSVAAAYASGL